jgi:hypothetical protein
MSILPRPSSPKVALRDLMTFFRTRKRHQFGFALLSIIIPVFFIALFYLDEVPMEYRPPKIVYVQKLDPNRSDAQIIAQQKIDAKQRAADEAERQKILEANRKPFKELDKKLDQWGL